MYDCMYIRSHCPLIMAQYRCNLRGHCPLIMYFVNSLPICFRFGTSPLLCTGAVLVINLRCHGNLFGGVIDNHTLCNSEAICYLCIQDHAVHVLSLYDCKRTLSSRYLVMIVPRAFQSSSSSFSVCHILLLDPYQCLINTTYAAGYIAIPFSIRTVNLVPLILLICV